MSSDIPAPKVIDPLADVPVNMPPGLKERIYRAASIEELNELLKEGTDYHRASRKTKKGWDKAAKVATKRLEGVKG